MIEVKVQKNYSKIFLLALIEKAVARHLLGVPIIVSKLAF